MIVSTTAIVRQGREHPERRHLSHVMWGVVLRIEHGVSLTGPFLSGYHRLGPTVPNDLQVQYERATALQLEQRDRHLAAGTMPRQTLKPRPHECYGFAGWRQLSSYFDNVYLDGLMALGFVVSEYQVPRRDIRTSPQELVFAKRDAVRCAIHIERPAEQ